MAGNYQRGFPYDLGVPSSNNPGAVLPQPYQGQRLHQTLGGRPPSPINMGNSDTIVRPTDINNVRFKSILENRGDNTGSVNITITTLILGGIVFPAGVNIGRFTSIIGRLVWGVGGTQSFVEFDWHTGNQLSVNATFFDVQAAINTDDEATPEEIQVGAFYTMGERPARSQVTRTFPKVELAPDGGQVAIPVPPFAHAVYIFAGNSNFYSPGNVEVRFAGGPSIGANYLTGDDVQLSIDGSQFLDSMQNEDGTRFPEQTRFIQIINNNLNETMDPTVTFTLDL